MAFVLPASSAMPPKGVDIGLFGINPYLLLATAALSTRFGYGRPAALARAFARAFSLGVSGSDFCPSGALVRQKATLRLGIVRSG